jgi:hypothetical protein
MDRIDLVKRPLEVAVLALAVMLGAACGGKNASAMHNASTSADKFTAAQIAPYYRTIKVGWTAKQVERIYGPQHAEPCAAADTRPRFGDDSAVGHRSALSGGSPPIRT